MKSKYYPISAINVICASRYKFQVNERRTENNMNINGEIKVFVNDFKNDKGEEAKLFSTSVSHKDLSGNYTYAHLDVYFSSKKFSKEQLNKFKANLVYTINVTEGFLTFRETPAGEKKFVVYVNDATIVETKELKAKAKSSNELPF